jgi:hypothetical protein
MLNGIFEYDNESTYDTGTLVVDVRETERFITLKIIKKDMRFSTYVDVLFKGKDKVRIKKERSPHVLRLGADWFCVYPDRMGKPLGFQKREKVGEG